MHRGAEAAQRTAHCRICAYLFASLFLQVPFGIELTINVGLLGFDSARFPSSVLQRRYSFGDFHCFKLDGVSGDFEHLCFRRTLRTWTRQYLLVRVLEVTCAHLKSNFRFCFGHICENSRKK